MMKRLVILLGLVAYAALGYSQDNRASTLRDLEKNQQANKGTKLVATLKSSSRLFGAKNDLTTVIMIVPTGSVVDVLDSDSTYLHIVYEENEGYIFRRHAVVSSATVTSSASNNAEQNADSSDQANQVQQGQQQEQVSRFTYLEEKYGSSMAARLNEGKIWKGMTAEMIRDSWGAPRKINRVISGNTIKEEWLYTNTWLYIQDDVLSDWGPINSK